MVTEEQIDRMHDQGYLVVENLLDQADIDILQTAFAQLEQTADRETTGLSWTEDLLTTILDLPKHDGPLVRLIQYRPLLKLLEQLMGTGVQLTGGIMLDKTLQNNFTIGWHQDSGIYVDKLPPGEPEDVRGGIPVLTPKGLELARNISCRIAIDPSVAESGGLYVIPESHKTRLSREAIKEQFENEEGVLAHQPPGAALFYHPLLLHRSGERTVPGRRRVLHLQYGPEDLELPGAQCYPWPQPCPLTPLDSLA